MAPLVQLQEGAGGLGASATLSRVLGAADVQEAERGCPCVDADENENSSSDPVADSRRRPGDDPWL